MLYKPTMHRALVLHPGSRCDAVAGIEVDAARAGAGAGALSLRYRVSGTMSALRIPREAMPARADKLWQHTCFEAFLRAEGAEAYYELNFSPSTQWAAYVFTRYRESMRIGHEIGAPAITLSRDATQCALRADLSLEAVPGLSGAAWQLGLAAVIEAADGTLSYWALAHADGKPDFHHPNCFALNLPAA